MNSSIGCFSTQSNISFLFDFWIQRVECLWLIVVKQSRLSIMLLSYSNYCLHFFWRSKSIPFLTLTCSFQSWMVCNYFFWCLDCILFLLDTKVVYWFISGFVAPIPPSVNCLLSLFFLSFFRELILPSNSAAQVVPVSVSVNGDCTDY